MSLQKINTDFMISYVKKIHFFFFPQIESICHNSFVFLGVFRNPFPLQIKERKEGRRDSNNKIGNVSVICFQVGEITFDSRHAKVDLLFLNFQKFKFSFVNLRTEVFTELCWIWVVSVRVEAGSCLTTAPISFLFLSKC